MTSQRQLMSLTPLLADYNVSISAGFQFEITVAFLENSSYSYHHKPDF